jgi:MoaA/NifB/PqqE/SkfB family radical SAM enzyme
MFCLGSNHSPRTTGLGAAQWLYLIRFGLEYFALGKCKPIAAGVPLTNFCNLSCRHCVVKKGNGEHYSFERICGWMDELYSAGARILYLQGGEILTWHDGDLRPNDVIAAARKKGYFRIAAVTNATFPITLDAHAIWVSFDGPERIHDEIRGSGTFAKLHDNVSACTHPRLYANLTLNRINAPFVVETILEAEHIPQFRGVSVNFHTPYAGVEMLDLSREERMEIVQKIIVLKRKGHRIINSKAGLTALGTGRYDRPVRMIRLVEKGRVFECCWGREQPGVCERCGYGIIAEMSAMTSLRPSALVQGLSLFW